MERKKGEQGSKNKCLCTEVLLDTVLGSRLLYGKAFCSLSKIPPPPNYVINICHTLYLCVLKRTLVCKQEDGCLSECMTFLYFFYIYGYFTGYILSLVLLTLPRQHLVKLYLYVLTALLLFAGHQVSR